MKILGHRGASADFPENTLEAMRGAVAQGADGVELDVMQCRTGELVVCHDEWLDRVAGRHLELGRLSWAELRSLDVGSPLGFAPARVPLLSEVFEALPADFLVNVEIKCDQIDDRGLSENVGAFITKHQLSPRVLLSSFNPLCLLRVGRAFPPLRRGLLIDPQRSWAAQVWGWLPIVSNASVHPHFSQCTARLIKRWHAQGLQVAVWTVDAPDEAKRLCASGVDFIITNRPAAVRAQL